MQLSIPNYFIQETWILVFSGSPGTNPLWIPRDDRVSHFVYPCICWCTVGSFPPFGYCGQCCCKHWCASVHWIPAFNPLGYTTLGELLCPMVNSVFNFFEKPSNFPTEAVPFDIPTSNAHGFWFLHILAAHSKLGSGWLEMGHVPGNAARVTGTHI